MTRLKLTVIFSFVLAGFLLVSCEEDKDDRIEVSNFNITMTGAKVVPANASTASGTVQATYNRKTHVLNYKLTWAGLAGTVAAIHIHGLAEAGFVALPSPLGPHPNGIVQTVPAGFQTTASGSYSGSLFVDNVVIKEADLLAGKYFIDIHSSVAPYSTTGEIRGQLTFAN